MIIRWLCIISTALLLAAWTHGKPISTGDFLLGDGAYLLDGTGGRLIAQ